MEIRFKLWIEKDHELVFSEWRARLLEAVDETGSLSDAAARLGVHYRIAWGKVRQMERRLGVKLLESHSGGLGGGGARLTPAARELLANYRALTQNIPDEIEQRFRRLFTEGMT